MLEKNGRKWSLRKEEKALYENLKTLKPNDESYKASLDSLETITTIRKNRSEKRMNVLKIAGGLAIGGLALFAAYQVDQSDDIPRNKASQRVFDKLFRF